jgi:hypothetical protein
MRSDLVFCALTQVSNRFLLTRVVANATRKFHRPSTRLEDTTNEVFERLCYVNPLAVEPHSGNLQPFRPTVQDGAPAFCEDLVQSVA